METQQLIELAFKEDLPEGDVTTDNLNSPEHQIKARLVAKEDLILSGREIFERCILHQAPSARLTWFFQNGDMALQGQTVCSIDCDNQKLLKAERVALNFLGHLSGIASLTRAFVNATKGTKCKILDTRKTTPLLRALEKMAVTHGGGVNHRMSLSDAVMIKDNHIDIAGSITEAVSSIRKKTDLPIEVECSTLEQVQECVKLPIQRVMLDNMSNETMNQCLKLIPRNIETEASGNMTVDRIKAVAELGVTYISVGVITHSAPQADFSLRMEKEK